MKSFIQQFQEIINEQFISINEKIKGTLFLEILKFQLIEKLSNMSDKLSFKDLEDNEYLFDLENTHKFLNVKLKNFKTPKTLVNYKILNNCLILCLNDKLIIDIEDIATNKYKNFNLIPLTGVTMPIDTICNVNYLKNSTILEINCSDKIAIEK